MKWLFPLLWLMAATSLAADLQVKPADYWTLDLTCKLDSPAKGPLTARTTIVQPQGFSRVVQAPVKVSQSEGRWQLTYPLLDEGRMDVKPGNWTGYWIMGQYQFRVELLDGERVIQTERATFDPMSLCPRDSYGPIFSKYPRQFIECSPERPAYIDTDQMSFTIRTLPGRVAECTAVVDVTARQDEKCLAGPWTMKLTGAVQRQTFDSTGWPRGEYWIRIRLERDGQPVGPYLIRKVWKEILPAEVKPAAPRRIGRQPQLLAGPFAMESVHGIRFVSDTLRKQPDAPLVTMEKPWETELMYHKSLHYDARRSEYVLEYATTLGDKRREAERAKLPSRVCRAVSKDGLTWTKPNLGLVNYRGSTDNNMVPPGQEYAPARPKAAAASLAHDHNKATFRFYDPQSDGPIDMQNVFVTAVKRQFTNKCPDPSSRPFRVGSWPMEKRGNEYLVLTRQPLLYLGVGMDLYHSTESIRLHVEDKSTGTLYYFFRPGAPAYPPHDTPYDNMHMTRRCLAVMWSQDGLHWDRRHIAVPDENDVPGTQLYVITVFPEEHESAAARPAMALEHHKFNAVVDGGRITLGSMAIYDAKANRQWPELVWTSDLIHWHRFATRRKMIANGPPWTYDYGMIKILAKYYELDGQWWFPYSAINTLHQDYKGLGRMSSLEQLKKEFPNFVEMPGFINWEQYWQRCKSMRYYPGIARCEKGRVCHAEPEGQRGELTTGPVVLAGKALLINAAAQSSGSLRVEVLDTQGQPLPGFGRDACLPLQDDSTAHEVRWRDAQLSKLQGKPVRLRFLLERARLYSFHVE